MKLTKHEDLVLRLWSEECKKQAKERQKEDREIERKNNLNKNWVELNRALKTYFKGEDGANLTMRFMRDTNDKTHLTIYIEGIDNCYDKKMDWHWDIFLCSDGTWKIA
jgi:hypothetical protein